MILSMNEQGLIFLFMGVLGFFFGIIYDIFRLLRFGIKVSLICYIEDFLFWVAASFFVLGSLVTINFGEVRAYMIFGFFGGMALYFIILSDIVMSFVLKSAALFAKILMSIGRAVMFPLKKLFSPFIKLINLIKLLLKKRAKCGIIKVKKVMEAAKEKFPWKIKKPK